MMVLSSSDIKTKNLFCFGDSSINLTLTLQFSLAAIAKVLGRVATYNEAYASITECFAPLARNVFSGFE